MPRGRTPMKVVAETHFNQSLWDLFNEKFQGIENAEAAAKKLLALSGGKVTTTPLTIMKTIERGKESGEIQGTPFYLGWLETVNESPNGEPAKKRGKESIRSKIEKYFNQSVWDVFRSIFAGVEPDEAEKTLKNKTQGKVTACLQAIKNTIEKGLEAGEIKDSEFFAAWVVRKRHRRSKNNPDRLAGIEGKPSVTQTQSKPQEPASVVPGTIPVKMVCECGHTWNTATSVIDEDCTMALVAKKCPKCLKWGEMMGITKHKGVQIQKKIIVPKGSDLAIESFVDLNGKEIKRPY